MRARGLEAHPLLTFPSHSPRRGVAPPQVPVWGHRGVFLRGGDRSQYYCSRHLVGVARSSRCVGGNRKEEEFSRKKWS